MDQLPRAMKNIQHQTQSSWQGGFSMEFARYRQVPAALQKEIIAARKAELAGAC